MKKVIKITESELNRIIENTIYNELPDGTVRTVGELREFIKNLPDDMGIENSHSSDTRFYLYKNKLHVSVD